MEITINHISLHKYQLVVNLSMTLLWKSGEISMLCYGERDSDEDGDVCLWWQW